MQNAEKLITTAKSKSATPIVVVSKNDWPKFRNELSKVHRNWASSQGFEAAPLTILQLPDAAGQISSVIVGAPPADADPFALGAISSRLPAGNYRFQSSLADAQSVALGWLLELYKYDPFRSVSVKPITLETPRGCDHTEVVALANAVYRVRDLVNAPTNILGPDALEKMARVIAKVGNANFRVVTGERLKRDFPLIHVVGAAAKQAPRLVDFTWGNPKHPKITLVGKGVCFDTGGLDIKPSSNMLLMKKDMGGAANVLGLAELIMRAKLNVRLRVLVPIVENSISDEAFRPGDVYRTRKGLTVEIGNTDAEGRLILCEALALADEDKPELLIDMATLTGAARVALGPDLPPFFTDDETFARDLHAAGMQVNDPLWRLPLWRPYYSMIETPMADLNNAGAGGFAGAITAALYLRRFVENAKTYAHFDIFAWVPNAKPGRPKGGESQAMRAVFAYLKKRYAK